MTRKIVDEESASSSNDSDSDHALSEDLDAGARASEEENEVTGEDAQRIDALNLSTFFKKSGLLRHKIVSQRALINVANIVLRHFLRHGKLCREKGM